MIKITKTQVKPYMVAGTTVPQTEEYSINYDDGRILKGRLWFEKKSDSLMVAFRDEEGNNRSPRKSKIDNEIALNGYYEVGPQGEKNNSQPRQKMSKDCSKIITEDDIKKYLNEEEVIEYQNLLEEQRKIYEKLEIFNKKINEGKEDTLLRETLKTALGKYDIEKIKKIIESM